MRVLRSLLWMALFFCTCVTMANPVMSESRAIAFPADIVNDTTAISTYTITNNTPVNFTGVTLRNLGGATQVTGAGLCSAAPFALNAGASCVLQIDFSATATGSVVGGPEVCPDSTGMNCSQPVAAQKIDFAVVSSPTPSMPTLTVPTSLVLTPGAAVSFTVTNSSAVTANNVMVTMPAALRAQMSSVTSCETIAPGGSCQISLTLKSTETSLTTGSVTVNGSNTQDSSLSLSINNIELTTSSTLQLVPGEEAVLPVKNTSSLNTATNVTIKFPGSMANDFDSVGSCASIAPGATCNVTLTPKASLSVLEFDTLIVGGSNTQDTSFGITLATVSLLATDVGFSAPGAQTLTLTNQSDVPVDVTGVTLAGTIYNVTVGSIPGACTDLAAGDSCTVTLTAATNAYGNGTITTAYTTGTGALATASSLAVGNTSVAVNGGVDIGVNPTDSIIKTITNTGDFSWQGANAALTSLTGVVLDATSCTAEALAPGQSCNITLTSTGATAGDSSEVTATGSNISSTAVNVLVNDAIVTTLDAADVRLQDRAVKIDNQGSSNKTLGNPLVSISPSLTGRIVECTKGGDNCANKESTCVAGTTLTAGQSCYVWLEAKEVESDSLGSATGTVTVDATESDSTIFDVNYGLDLYIATVDKKVESQYGSVYRWDGTTSTGIGNSNSNTNTTGFYTLAVYQGDLYSSGRFTSAGGVSAANIAKWNGSAWSALGSGLTSGSGSARGIAVYDNKLVVGGDFWVAGGVNARLVAEWDGSSWSGMGSGSTSNASVYDVHTYNGKLYAAGSFTTIRDVDANRIAEWDGTDWTALNGGVSSSYILAMTTYNNKLIVGGIFADADGMTVNNIAAWDGSAWSALTDGVNNSVGAFAELGGNLYVGGSFTEASGTTTNRLAEWNDTKWLAVSGATFNSYITALDSYDGKLFAGGRFTSPGSYEVEWDGASTWTALSFGGNIANQDPQSTLVVPSIVSIAAQ